MATNLLNTPLIEHSPLAVYLSDMDGKIQLTNPAASRMSGYSMAELSTMNVTDLDVVHNTQEALDRIWKSIPLNRSVVAQSRHRTKDSHLIDVEVHLSKIHVDGEDLFCGHVKDITEQLAIKQALERNHDMLDKLARQVPGVVYQYRLYPDRRSCFPYSSPGMWDIYRYHPEDVVEDATPVFGRLHPEDIDRVT